MTPANRTHFYTTGTVGTFGSAAVSTKLHTRLERLGPSALVYGSSLIQAHELSISTQVRLVSMGSPMRC